MDFFYFNPEMLYNPLAKFSVYRGWIAYVKNASHRECGEDQDNGYNRQYYGKTIGVSVTVGWGMGAGRSGVHPLK